MRKGKTRYCLKRLDHIAASKRLKNIYTQRLYRKKIKLDDFFDGNGKKDSLKARLRERIRWVFKR